jgi:hypothetical protein
MQQKLILGSTNLVLTGSRKPARDKKQLSLEQKITPAVHMYMLLLKNVNVVLVAHRITSTER